jgi:hypothetical protein
MTLKGAAVMPAIGAAMSGTCSGHQQGTTALMHICQLWLALRPRCYCATAVNDTSDAS